MELSQRLERILPEVQKPARYVGGEYGQIIKNKNDIDIRFALCFPDIYEIGMSNLGLRILYGVLNSMEGVWCERVFEPWRDMAVIMKERGIPLFALESGDPIRNFDIIGFSVGYELSYAGMLEMLALAGLPLKSSERKGLSPLVFAGGTCMFNPEPLADFIDLAVIGEGEEADVQVVELYRVAKREGWCKVKFLAEAAKLEGIYVPSLYEHTYIILSGVLSEIIPAKGARKTVAKRIVKDLDRSFFPVDTLVPSTEIVHDRTVLEIFRGCIRGCRFCQAGYVYRPVRSKRPETLIRQGIEALQNSGYEEISLSSLSTSDYKKLQELCDGLLEWCEPRKPSLSLPSLRADNFSMELMKKVQKVRKSGLTFAPEAGSQRLRDVINKNVTEEDILNSCATAFEGGWNAVKLYFMLGLPTETDEDVLAIADLANKVYETWRRTAPNRARGVRITVSASCFVPKPMTPFQWCAQNTIEEFRRKQGLLRQALKNKSIVYNWHSPETSFIEAVLALGDRRLCPALEEVQRSSGGLKAWDEYFDFRAWLSAFEKHGIDPGFYALREKGENETLAWDTLSAGVSKAFLWRQYKLALAGKASPDCRQACLGCGASELAGGFCEVRAEGSGC